MTSKSYFEHNAGEPELDVVEFVADEDTAILPITPERMDELRKLAERWHEARA